MGECMVGQGGGAGEGTRSLPSSRVARKGSWSKAKAKFLFRPLQLPFFFRRGGSAAARPPSNRLARALVLVLSLCITLSILHMATARGAMTTKKLDLVLSVFETASYHPTLKGLHLPVKHEQHVFDMPNLAPPIFHYNHRSLLTSAAAESAPPSAPPLPAAAASQSLDTSHGSSLPQCGVTFRMNVTDDTAKSLDLDDFDLELLGTIMVRLCDCKCAGQKPPLKGALVVMEEILKGAHVVVEGDSGSFYSWFVHIQDSYRRISSHYSIVPSYGVPEGAVLRTLLTGRDVHGNSWFQFESAGWAPFSRPLESIVHAVNYVKYIVTGSQVGPLGNSAHTDRRPIRLRFDGCVDPRRRLFRQLHPDDDTGKTRRIQLLRRSEKKD